MNKPFLLLMLVSISNATEMAGIIETAFVSKVDVPEMARDWACDCYNSSSEVNDEIHCTCYGNGFERIPDDLGDVHILTVIHSNVKILRKGFFAGYSESLTDVNLQFLPDLEVIEGGIFENVTNLRSVYIAHAYKLSYLTNMFEGIVSLKFLSLRIMHTGLEEVPNLSPISSDNILHMVDIAGNKLKILNSNSIRVNAEQVTLTNNEITEIKNFAFNGSQIGKLSLLGNRALTHIQENAFKGINNLRSLDLSETSINKIPVIGLQNLEVLKIESTYKMKTIPSVYELESLKEAYLTHPFHCCAFKYPKTHDPAGYEARRKKLERLGCNEETSNFDTGQSEKRTKRRTPQGFNYENGGDLKSILQSTRFVSDYRGKYEETEIQIPGNVHHSRDYNKTDHSHLRPLIGEVTETQKANDFTSFSDEEMGVFHMASAEVTDRHEIKCGKFVLDERNIKCYPEPNALNPCEDIMGFQWLRISVWFIAFFAIAGNVAVISVLIFGGGELTVSKFLITNLAFGDLCMAIYLLILAAMDLHSAGEFFNHAYDWQYGIGCQLAGFLTIFASHLSVFALAIVTLERWFAITYAIHLNMRITTNIATKTMLGGWIYSLVIAAMPLVGVSNYSSTSICLPMEVDTIYDKLYIYIMIITNVLAFGLMVFCYTQIYYSLAYETRRMYIKGDLTIAKKMALLVFTDFACWVPIAFFSLTALAGYPLIGVTRSKILLVFFYPLNSCANPYLYAVTTSQYRRDFYNLISRCNLCRRRIHRYSTSSAPTNNSNPIPLLSSERNWSYKRNNTSEIVV